MVNLGALFTGAHVRGAARPFDLAVSLILDAIQISLDAGTPLAQRIWLRAWKRVYEVRVPACYPAGGGR